MNHHREFQYHLKKYAWPLAVVLLTIAAAYFIFGSYLYKPNQEIYAIGGDALVIYYDMLFHTCYGEGPTLSAMNYPYGEYIFLTDAQGAFSMVLQWINRYLFEVCDAIPGIIHALNIYLLPVCSLFIFYILKYFKVRNLTALLFSVLITFLSPQMLRFGGHFGLAYPFVIPMVMWWFLRKYHYRRLEICDAAVFGVLVFFTYNNPYVGFSAGGFLIVAGLLLFVPSLQKKEYFKPALIIVALGLLALLIPYLDFKINDPVTDRLKQQWGYFIFQATWRGLLYPPDSLLNQLISNYQIELLPVEFESMLNIGLISVLLLFGILVWIIKSALFKPSIHNTFRFPPEIKILAAAAMLMFLYAGSAMLGMDQDWTEEKLGPLLMFKASGRLAWSAYYVITISCVFFLDGMLKKIKQPVLQYLLIGLTSTVWAYEIYQYVGKRYEHFWYENSFLPKNSHEILDVVEKNNIRLSEYQAMLIVPRLMAWTDNFLSFMHWESQFYGMRFSAATGLPMINAMLSRMSTGHTAEAIQFLSHPLIEGERLAKLPNRKDILLLLGANHPPLGKGEQFLLDISEPLYASEQYSLFRLRLADLENNQFLKAASELYTLPHPEQPDIIHYGFDTENAGIGFYGQGAKTIHQGSTVLVDERVPSAADTIYVFSAWTKIDHEKYGMGDWKISITDSTGQVTFEGQIETRRSNDIQDLWIRSELSFPVKKGSKITAVINSNRTLTVDEVLIYPQAANVLYSDAKSPDFILNGYKVKKPGGG